MATRWKTLISALMMATLASAEVRVGVGDDLAAACDRAISDPDKTVRLSPGTHSLSRPLQFDPRHSGLKLVGDKGAVLSGGISLTEWRETEPGVWECTPAGLPQDRRTLRILRVGDEWATLARRPNFQPEAPLKGGWLFTEKRRSGKGSFNQAVGKIHSAGDWLEWNVEVPSAGRYRVFFRYAADNAPFGNASMAGRTQLQVDGGAPVVLQGLDDTGDWGKLAWSKVAEIDLSAGKHRLRWTNLQGGGLNFDAMAFSTDAQWVPEGTLEQRGGSIVVQAESVIASQTKEGYFPEGAESDETGVLHYKPGDFREDADLANVEIHMFPAWGWVNAIVYPESIDPAERLVKLEKTESASQPIWSGNRYYIANSRADMDQPGEWCIDRQKGVVALRAQARPAGVVLPVLKTLIEVKGATDVLVSGIEFRDTACSSDFGVYSPNDACITIEGGEGIRVEDNRFLGIGGYALALRGGSHATRFVTNEVGGAGQGGVILEGSAQNQATDTLIAANWIHDCGRLYKHVAGVYGVTASRTRVAHNRFERLPRYAISFKSFSDDSNSHDNLIEYNQVLETNLETNDTGAIETLGRHYRDMNNTIRFNLIRDVVGFKTMPDGEIKSPYMTWGIYLDDYSSGTTVYGNIVANTQWGAACIHGGANNLIENNIFIDGAIHQLRYQPRDERFHNNRVLRNVFYTTSEAADLFHSSGRFPPDAQLESDHNLLWHLMPEAYFQRDRLTPEGTLAQWRSAGYDQHSQIGDPLFTDPAHGDYTLRPGSPAFRMGFAPIPTRRIGLAGWNE